MNSEGKFFAPEGIELGHQLPGEPFGLERYEEIPDKYIRELYHNPHIKTPLDWKKYALFVDRFKRESKPEHSDAIILSRHHRAVNYLPEKNLVEERRLADGSTKELNYTTVNVKGGGMILPETYDDGDMVYGVDNPEIIKHDSGDYPWGYDLLGLMDGRVAQTLQENTDKFIEQGGRVESIAALFAIDAAKYQGKWRTIDELRKMTDEEGHLIWPKTNFTEINSVVKEAKSQADKKYLEDLAAEGRYIGEYQPVIAVRLQRNPYRIKDFDQEVDPAVRRKILVHALNVVSWEQKLQNKDFPQLSAESWQDVLVYLKLMASWTAKNLAVLENMGKFMKFFNSGNVTMAGELVDLDSVVDAVKKNKDGSFKVKEDNVVGYAGNHEEYDLSRFVYKDMRDAIMSLYKMYTAIKEVCPELGHGGLFRREMSDEFLSVYEQSLSDNIGITQLVPKDKLIDLAKTLLDKRYVNQEKLPRTSVDDEA